MVIWRTLGADFGSVVQTLVEVFPCIEDVDFFVFRCVFSKEDAITRGGEASSE